MIKRKLIRYFSDNDGYIVIAIAVLLIKNSDDRDIQ